MNFPDSIRLSDSFKDDYMASSSIAPFLATGALSVVNCIHQPGVAITEDETDSLE